MYRGPSWRLDMLPFCKVYFTSRGGSIALVKANPYISL